MGARTIDGVAMLVHQGAKAFELWTGVEPPIEVMERAVRRELVNSWSAPLVFAEYSIINS